VNEPGTGSRFAWATSRRTRRLGLLAVLLAVGLGGTIAWWTSRAAPSVPAQARPVLDRPVVSADDLPDRAGIRLVRVSVSGAGGLVDLRYQVLDPDKAHALHEPATPPVLIDEASGVVIKDLLMGHSHKGTYKPAVTYYLVFENPGNWVHRGSEVTVLLGDAQVEHVRVS
jgi:predicted ribosomally synthesized peptide with SipW-like signal peptide